MYIFYQEKDKLGGLYAERSTKDLLALRQTNETGKERQGICHCQPQQLKNLCDPESADYSNYKPNKRQHPQGHFMQLRQIYTDKEANTVVVALVEWIFSLLL